MTEKIYTEENSEYLKNHPTWHIEDSPWKAKQIIKILKQNSINPKSIAEVGCGAGEILNQLYQSMSNDVIFTGYDISNDAIRLAKQREKKRLEFKRENILDTNSKFDLLLMIDVFEHIDDYLGFLKSKIAVLPRKLMYKANKDIAAKLLGGFSLLVLTK